MRIIIGTYKNTKYTFLDETRKITVYGFPWRFDIDTIKLCINNTGLNNSSIGYVLLAPSIAKATISYSSPSSALVAETPTSGGSVTTGIHSYKVTYVYNTGDESIGSITSNQIETTSGYNTVGLSSIPIGPSGVIQRKIYRTVAGNTGNYKLLTILNDNTTTTYNDTIADGSLGIDIPIISNAYDINYSSPLPTLDLLDKLLIDVEVPDATKDDSFDAIKNIPQIMSELPAADSEVAIISDTNLAINTYFYELSQSSWRNFIAQIKATCSTTSSILKIYATLDPAAVVPSSGGTPSVDWVDITNSLFGSATISIPTSGTYQDIRSWSIDNNKSQVMYDRYLVSYQTLDATNFIQINIRKF